MGALDYSLFRDITFASVSIRIVLAVICGGAIGLERAYKRRPAGFRTHILICMGAAITTLTSEYIVTYLGLFTDIGRLGAQVIAGIGFIGAGSIIVTPKQRIKGLTTAAGLWATAIIGLALGAGFYEGGIATTVLILMAELVFSKLEYRILASAREMNLYMEYTDKDCLESVLAIFRETETKVMNMTITRSESSKRHYAAVIFYLRIDRKQSEVELLRTINDTKGVINAEEI